MRKNEVFSRFEKTVLRNIANKYLIKLDKIMRISYLKEAYFNDIKAGRQKKSSEERAIDAVNDLHRERLAAISEIMTEVLPEKRVAPSLYNCFDKVFTCNDPARDMFSSKKLVTDFVKILPSRENFYKIASLDSNSDNDSKYVYYVDLYLKFGMTDIYMPAKRVTDIWNNYLYLNHEYLDNVDGIFSDISKYLTDDVRYAAKTALRTYEKSINGSDRALSLNKRTANFIRDISNCEFVVDKVYILNEEIDTIEIYTTCSLKEYKSVSEQLLKLSSLFFDRVNIESDSTRINFKLTIWKSLDKKEIAEIAEIAAQISQNNTNINSEFYADLIKFYLRNTPDGRIPNTQSDFVLQHDLDKLKKENFKFSGVAWSVVTDCRYNKGSKTFDTPQNQIKINKIDIIPETADSLLFEISSNNYGNYYEICYNKSMMKWLDVKMFPEIYLEPMRKLGIELDVNDFETPFYNHDNKQSADDDSTVELSMNRVSVDSAMGVKVKKFINLFKDSVLDKINQTLKK